MDFPSIRTLTGSLDYLNTVLFGRDKENHRFKEEGWYPSPSILYLVESSTEQKDQYIVHVFLDQNTRQFMYKYTTMRLNLINFY